MSINYYYCRLDFVTPIDLGPFENICASLDEDIEQSKCEHIYVLDMQIFT